MTTKYFVLTLCIGLAGVSLTCGDHASAFPIAGSAVEQSAPANSSVTQAQYYERHTRYGIVKCYRSLVIGRYRCHRY